MKWLRRLVRNKHRKSLFPAWRCQSDEGYAKTILYHVAMNWAWAFPDEWRNDPDMVEWARLLRTYDVIGFNL